MRDAKSPKTGGAAVTGAAVGAASVARAVSRAADAKSGVGDGVVGGFGDPPHAARSSAAIGSETATSRMGTGRSDMAAR